MPPELLDWQIEMDVPSFDRKIIMLGISIFDRSCARPASKQDGSDLQKRVCPVAMLCGQSNYNIWLEAKGWLTLYYESGV